MKIKEAVNRYVQKTRYLVFRLGASLLTGNIAFASPPPDPFQETQKVTKTMALGSLGVMFAILMILGISSAGLTIKGYMEGMHKAKQDQSGHPAIGGLQGMISTAGGAWIITFIVAYLFNTLTNGNLFTIIQDFINNSISGSGV